MGKRQNQSATKKRKVIKHQPDFLLIGIILLLVGFGIVMVYSASYYYGQNHFDNPFYFVKNQGKNAFLGILGMAFVIWKFNYRILSNYKIAWILYLGSLGLAASLFFIGSNYNGATRWIQIGGFTIQPSEFVKIGVIIMLSAYIVKYRNKLNKVKYICFGFLLVIVPVLLVAIENLSSAIVVGVVGMFLLVISTPKIWYHVGLFILAVVASMWVYSLAMSTTSEDTQLPGIAGKLPMVDKILKPYRLEGFRVWKDPYIDPKGKGYQPIQSLYAIGSGGVFGTGLTEGVQKLGFLPEPHNDIIFAVICEELGLVGAILLLITYLVLVLRGFSIAMHAYDLFGVLLAGGISMMVGIQVIINVAVNTNTIPTTGMQLPLVSFGGTALIILLGALGLLVNVSRIASIEKPSE